MHDQGLSSKSSKTSHNQYHHSSHTHKSDTVARMNVREVFVGEGVDQRHKEVNPGQAKEVLCLQFPQLSRHDQLVHAVFTRQGGVSESPYDTLNTSYNTGDKPECVSRNLQIIKEAIGAKHLVFMNQMHGKEILILRQDEFEDFKEPANADALITDIPQLALMVKQADCQGVILFDPMKGVVSNVHCGWKGNAHNILGSVVGRMRSDFGCGEADLMAAIGPSLGPCCAEFADYEQVFPEKFRRFMVRKGYFDLWGISRWQLLEAGLKKDNIEMAGVCTRCKTDMLYSFRAEGMTGRCATVAMLKMKNRPPGLHARR
jgi:YfiH family protein